MAEAALLPAVRDALPGTTLIANGTSCRQQIKHGSGREAVHIVQVLQRSLGPLDVIRTPPNSC